MQIKVEKKRTKDANKVTKNALNRLGDFDARTINSVSYRIYLRFNFDVSLHPAHKKRVGQFQSGHCRNDNPFLRNCLSDFAFPAGYIGLGGHSDHPLHFDNELQSISPGFLHH
jgi:hypothetical protein